MGMSRDVAKLERKLDRLHRRRPKIASAWLLCEELARLTGESPARLWCRALTGVDSALDADPFAPPSPDELAWRRAQAAIAQGTVPELARAYAEQMVRQNPDPPRDPAWQRFLAVLARVGERERTLRET